MNILAFVSITTLLVSTPAGSPECALSVRPVIDGKAIPEAVIKPEHVLDIVHRTDEPTGMQLWEVRLTAAGAEINREFSRESIGKEISVFCGEVEVARPRVVYPSSDTFAFTFSHAP